MRCIILACVLYVCAFTLHAQNEACKERLIKSFSSMEKLYSDSSHLYMHYKVKTMQAANKALQTDEVKVYLTDSIYVVTSSMSSYYSDKKDAFMIMPMQRKMYRLDVQSVRNKTAEQATLFRKEMLDSSVVLSCVRLEDQTERISVRPPASFMKYAHIIKVDYVCDVMSGFIKECTIFYAEGNALISTQYLFIEIKQQVTLPFRGGVKELLLGQDNLPAKNFAGYRYTDLRQNK